MSSGIELRRQRLREAFPAWRPRTLDAWLDDCAERFVDRPMVITDDLTVSYGEVAAWSWRLADGLVALGVRPGDHVGLLMANYLEFVPLKFAISRAGAVAVPLNYLYRAGELLYVLGQSECSVLVTMTGFGSLDYLNVLDDIAPGWDTAEGADELPMLRHVVLLSTDDRYRDGVGTVETLGALGEANSGGAGAPGSSARRPDDVGDMLYTSGTTGSPKGVLVTHDAVQRTGYASALTRAFEDGRRILFSLPCYHMFGYVEGLMAAMVVGGAIIPQTTFDPAAYLAGIERHRATDVLCVPTMTVALLEHSDRHHRDLSSVFAMLSGSAPGPVWLWQRVVDELGISEVVTGYGMTECGGAMTLTLPEDPLQRHADTVGKPKLAGVAGIPEADAVTAYKTIDPETGDDLPTGAEGELASHGPTDMQGFWGKAKETAATIHHGWVRSGDLGRVDNDGYLELTGRSKELYKSGGELVMPKEIEELLSAHPAISQAYLVGVPDERWGDAGCACVVLAPGGELSASEVIGLCKEKLARFKVPKHVLFLDAEQLPTTPTGKVQKFQLVRLVQRQLAADEESKERSGI